MRLAWEAARCGRGGIVLLEGEAGIGKSRLLDELVGSTDMQQVLVLRCAGDELERRRAFGVLADCIGAAAGFSDVGNEMRRLSGTALASPHGGWEFEIVEALLTVLDQLVATSPVILVVDDAQWIDPSSAVVLHRLGRVAPQLPLLIVCSYRPLSPEDEVTRALGRLRTMGATLVHLGPLDPEEVRTLATALLGAAPGPNIQRLLAGAAGNPLFVIELAAALTDAGEIVRTGDAVDAQTQALPASLPLTILHNVSFLRSATLDVLRVASVLGLTFSATELSAVLRRPTVDLLTMLRDAIRAGILQAQGERLAFRHELVRAALYEDLPASIRAGLHLDAATALSKLPGAEERVAEHYVRGAQPGNREAVSWLRAAATRVAGTAPGIAAELLERAASLCAVDDPERDEILAERAARLMWAGRLDEAEEICRSVLGRSTRSRAEGRLRVCLLQLLLLRAQAAATRDEGEAALASSALSPSERARCLAWVALAYQFLGDLAATSTLGAEARRLAEAAHDPLAGCAATLALAVAANAEGRLEESLELADEAVVLAQALHPGDGHRSVPHLTRSLFLTDMDRIEEAFRSIDRGRRTAEEAGAFAGYHIALARLQFVAGQWDDALAEVSAAIELGQWTGTRWTIAAHAIRGLIALCRDELETAREAIQAAEHEMQETGPQYGLDLMFLGRALQVEAEGEGEAAVEMLWQVWSEGRRRGVLSSTAVLGPDLVRLAVLAGDRDRAREVLDAVCALASLNPAVPSLEGMGARLAGLVDDDVDRALRAVAVTRNAPRPREHALACEDAAVALARGGRSQEARELAHESLARYHALKAERDGDRAEARLRAAGLRLGRRGTRRRSRTGWDSLTESELRVARLVAAGRSNPEIADRLYVSRHTVQSHVSNILMKLGLRSRVELAAFVASRIEIDRPAPFM